MAEQVPYGLATSLINTLASLALREVGLVYGVQGELERLKETTESINAVLLDAEEKQQNHAVKVWIKRLKGVLLATDDVVDDFAIDDLLHRVDGPENIVTTVRHFLSFPKRIVHKWNFRRKMAHKIVKIRKSFNDVVKEMSTLNLSQGGVVMKQNESAWREASSRVTESEIIGRDDSKREIINLLKQSQQNEGVSVIAVVGLGGLGKTAIAQLVYNDVEVQNFFNKRMWVCVSNNFDVKTIVRKMLESLLASKDDQNLRQQDTLSLEILQQKLHNNLSGKRYLLVLDDIWNEDSQKWNELRSYLMCDAVDSKVLVTTRSERVAQKMGVRTPYCLRGLGEEESWRLLRNSAFGEGAEGMTHALEPIGKKIAKKCKGVPLAIRAVGGILQSKYEESEWINAFESGFWKLCKDEDSSIMPVLKLSYENLSSRQCFIYCSLYPKDYVIDKNELIQLWMAEGYLQCSSGKKHMEDVGNEIVETLLMKSFFQDAEINHFGEMFCFKTHDLMHDLATQVAGNDCYLDSEREGLVGRPMQLSLESNNAIDLFGSLDARQLRTLYLRSDESKIEMKKELSVILSFKCLRVLNLSKSSLKELPNSIDKLKHLRYLDLSWCRQLASLPNSIGNLVNLQTLKLNWCQELEFSTKVVTKLINLRHLDVFKCNAFKNMVPAGLGKLSSLQYLSNFVVGHGENKESGKLNELKDLNNLGGELRIERLGLVRDVALESQEVNLKEKKRLKSLTLDWSNSESNNDSLQLLENLRPHQDLKSLDVWSYPGEIFPSWLSSLTNISHIRLFYSDVHYLPPLDRLQFLRSLYIQTLKKLEYICFEVVNPTAAAFFPSLELLYFAGCPQFRGWQRMGDEVGDAEYSHHLSLPPFPRLSKLCIQRCPKLTCMPTFPCLNKELKLESSSVKPLAETLNVAAPNSSSSSFTPLSELKTLDITRIAGHRNFAKPVDAKPYFPSAS